jgi:ATP-dependent DNA helicase HFM1/MER3
LTLHASYAFSPTKIPSSPLAPTAAGKTVIFDLAIIRLLQSSASNDPLNPRDRRVGEMKVVYLAPIKALCSERVDDWNKRFGPLGVKCKGNSTSSALTLSITNAFPLPIVMELTSDTAEEFQVAVNVDVIVTTPEKWDR